MAKITEVLPYLDRRKVLTFVTEEKARLALRGGQWVPENNLPPRIRWRYAMVREILERIVSGEFDRVYLAPGDQVIDALVPGRNAAGMDSIDAAIEQCGNRATCPVQALLERS